MKVILNAITIYLAIKGLQPGTWTMAGLATVSYLDLVTIWIFVWQFFRTSFMFSKIFTQVGIDYFMNGGDRPDVVIRVHSEDHKPSINDESEDERIDIYLVNNIH